MARATWLAAVLSLTLLARPSPAQEPPGAAYAGRAVTAVRIDLDGRPVTDPGVVDLVETRVGFALSLAQVRQSIAHLFNLGRFQDIQVEASRDGAGVALRYVLMPVKAVRQLHFRGTTELPAGRLRRVLEDRFGGIPSVGRAADAARVLEDAYAAAGFTRARVTPSAEWTGETREPVLVFDVVAGPRARVGRVVVEGEAGEAPASITGRLGIRRGEYYDRAEIQRSLDRYLSDLRERSHYEAEAGHTARARDDGSVVDITLDLRPGPVVSVSFEGDPLPGDRLEELVPVRREASADEDLLEDSDVRITRFLNAQGYWQAEVSHRREVADGRLAIVFTIRKGPSYQAREVEIAGAAQVAPSELRLLARLKAGEPFVQSRLDADVLAIEAYYRRQGFAFVRVSSSVEAGDTRPASGAAAVTPRITIEEGPRVALGRIRFEGNLVLTEADLHEVMTSEAGRPYYEPAIVADRDAVAVLYLNRGYESAQIQVDRQYGADRTSADLVFMINEGPQSVVDHILIVGNTRTKTSTIERELLLRPGDPLGLAKLIESQQRLSALGLFRRVRISPVAHGGSARKDLLVLVEEAPATSIGYGGGLEGGRRLRTNPEGGPAEERIELAPRGFFEIGRRNIWGKNRSVNVFTRVSLRPSDDPELPAEEQGGRFTEYRVIGNYREPRAFGREIDVLASGVLEQGVRTAFNFNRKGAAAELLRRLSPILRVSGRYTFNYTKRFDERIDPSDRALIDRLFPEVRLSSISGNLFRDTRDDAIDPTRGGWASVDLELASRILGSEVGFAKGYLQGFHYRQLFRQGNRRLVLALGARVGLAAGFVKTVTLEDANGDPVVGPDGTTVEVRVDDVPASERFYAGGDTTVRGFTLDRLGTPETLDPNGFPNGGNGMLIFNAELRAQVFRNIGAVVFVDAGNVYRRVPDVSLSEIRPTAGLGLRYQSPIGPLRVDLGFKLDRKPGEKLTALYFSFGQAF